MKWVGRASNPGARLVLWSVPILACGADHTIVPPEVPSATAAPEGWKDVSQEIGLDFRHHSGAAGAFLIPEIMGGGGALFDYDGDGDLDVYLVGGGVWPVAAEGEDDHGSDRLFAQQGDGRFSDVTAEAGVGNHSYGMGCAVGDVDNDGDLDLYLTSAGADTLFVNRGDGRFTPAGPEVGLGGHGWTTSAAFVDYDRDGALDLFVARYLEYDPPKACTDPTGRPDYCGPEAFVGLSDLLFRNQGDGTFRDVSEETGLSRRAGKGLGVLAADLDDDGWCDLYVANDGMENHLWINRGGVGFEERAVELGVAVNLFGKPEASMGLALGDVDGDGAADIFATHLDRETNTLYVGSERGAFEDRTALTGLGAPSLRTTGFGAILADLDADGDLDLFVANGAVRRSSDLSARGGEASPYAERDLLFENGGGGRFHPLTRQAGELTARTEVTRAAIAGDVDGDGDLDLLLTHNDGPVRLFRNDLPQGHWLKLQVYDPALQRDAIGAVVEIVTGALRQRRWVSRAGSYLAAGPSTVHVGLGASRRADRVTVRWPDGSRESFSDLAADQSVVLRRGEGVPE